MKRYLVNSADCNLGDGDLELVHLEEGETVLTKEETSELAEVLSTGYISADFPNAKEAVRKLLKNRK